jgi:hypothetical protein
MMEKFEIAAAELIRVSELKKCSIRCSFDLVDSGILTRGFADHAERNSPGGGRRPFDDVSFIAAVEAFRDKRKSKVAA